jgi:hypothetical protein
MLITTNGEGAVQVDRCDTGANDLVVAYLDSCQGTHIFLAFTSSLAMLIDSTISRAMLDLTVA